MNIDEIEQNLNRHEADPHKVLNVILNVTAKNQAILETLVEMNLNLMRHIHPSMDGNAAAKEITGQIAKNLAEIQASIASGLE